MRMFIANLRCGGLEIDKEKPSNNHSTWRSTVQRQTVQTNLQFRICSLQFEIERHHRAQRQVRLLSIFPSPHHATLVTISWRTNSVHLTFKQLGLSFSPEADVKLVHLIQPNRVFLNLEAKNLEEAIRLLVPLVVRDKPQVDQMRLIDEVLGRERLVSTIVGRGFALPHARSDEVSELTIGVGIFPEGLENPTPDGEPVKAVFLLLEPKRVSKLYLKTLGVLARLARMEGILSKLVSAKDSDQFIETIKETDLVVTERLCAGDIARSTEPAYLGMTLKQVADLFFRNDILTLPVLNTAEKVVGVVRCSDLLHAAMPEYARMIGGLRFLSEFEPFDRFLHEEDRMPVDSVMTKDYIEVEETASIVEVTSLLLHHKENAMVVTKEGSYLGMVSLRDIITKVMRT